MNDPLRLTTRLNTSYIQATAQPRLVYALLQVEVGELPRKAVPIDLALVVDASVSMQIPLVTEEQFRELASMGAVQEVIRDGIPVWRFDYIPPGFSEKCPRRLDYVIMAIVAAVEALRRDGRCGLIAFAGSAQRLAPVTPAARRSELLKAARRLGDIDLGDETRLASGLSLAVEELASASKARRDALRRILLLTDGFAIDEDEALAWGKRALAAGISLSTMGIGDEFNESLLLNLADSSAGNAYLIEDPADIPHVFDEELRAVQSVSLRELEIKLRLYGGVELRRCYRVKPAISDLGAPQQIDHSANIDLGDLDPNAPPAVLLELVVPPRPPGRYRLAQALLAHTAADGSPGPKVPADLVIEAGPDAGRASSYDPSVMNLVETVSAFKLQTQALADAERGDVAGATTKLRAAATRLLGLGEEELAATALQEAQTLEDQGALSAAATKKLRYETRKLTQKLG